MKKELQLAENNLAKLKKELKKNPNKTDRPTSEYFVLPKG